MRILVIIFILVAIVIGGIFYLSAQKNTEILVVEVTLAKPQDNDSAKIISQVNAHLSYAKALEVPKETPLEAPGITVLVAQDKTEISRWYSVPIPSGDSIYGTYNIKVRLTENIDMNQPVRILTRVLDPAGNDVSVKATEIRLS